MVMNLKVIVFLYKCIALQAYAGHPPMVTYELGIIVLYVHQKLFHACESLPIYTSSVFDYGLTHCEWIQDMNILAGNLDLLFQV